MVNMYSIEKAGVPYILFDPFTSRDHNTIGGRIVTFRIIPIPEEVNKCLVKQMPVFAYSNDYQQMNCNMTHGKGYLFNELKPRHKNPLAVQHLIIPTFGTVFPFW